MEKNLGTKKYYQEVMKMINEEKVIISNGINIGATIAYKDKNDSAFIFTIVIVENKHKNLNEHLTFEKYGCVFLKK